MRDWFRKAFKGNNFAKVLLVGHVLEDMVVEKAT